ncbi:MAG: Rrf2 family transcriptional regulator [Phycisphaeraceae bacterium]|nr:Rrf2 family transcriptional regulator [Phycisphaeraceae bacterium]
MIYSSACSYAIRALSRLAVMRPDGYVLLDELCGGTDLPRHFVAKIFQDLVRKGLLISAKGRGGGFALSRPADQISVYDIVAAIDGVSRLDECVVGLAKCDDAQPCPQHEQWSRIRTSLKDFLMSTSLSTMSNTLERKLELLGHSIPTASSRSKPVKPDDGTKSPSTPGQSIG